MKKIILLAALFMAAISYGQILSVKSANREVADCTAGGKNPVSYPTDYGGSTASYAGPSGTLNWEINENIPNNDRKFVVAEVNFTEKIDVGTANSDFISIPSGTDFILTSFANRGTANNLDADCTAAGFPTGNHKKVRFNLEYTGTYITDPITPVSVDVTVTDILAGVTKTIVVTITPPAPLSVEDLSIYNFNYFPNPTSDILNLSAAKNINKVEIINLLGQKSKSINVNALRKTINISDLPTGIYIMRVTIDEAIGSYKIIKR